MENVQAFNNITVAISYLPLQPCLDSQFSARIVLGQKFLPLQDLLTTCHQKGTLFK
jgi:hypothetical protein